MNDVIGFVHQTLEDSLAPELRQHRAELAAIRSEIRSVRSELTSRIKVLESRLESKLSVLENKMNVLDSKVGSGFSALRAQLENAALRGELFTTREITDLRIRVERLERSAASRRNS